MPFKERKAIIESIGCVDMVIDFEDDELGSCIDALEKVKILFPNDELFFANGGDRNNENIPEMSVDGIEFLFGIGGNDKKNSSSWILNNWQYYFEQREWGAFFNLFETKGIKVKELIVEPGKSMSFQKHLKRNEIWLVSEGECEVKSTKQKSPDSIKKIILKKFDHFLVSVGQWHQIINNSEKQTRIIEIQYGDECIEEDIQRKEIR
jgi:mannose-6-phosphate isomerase-like protein (cupin superfamily)